MHRWAWGLAFVGITGCAVPILSKQTVVDPEPEPMCKIAGYSYAAPDAGPLDPPKRETRDGGP